MAEVSRRSFLKLAAATGAAAAVPGCQPAARHLVPYIVPDEHVIPGVPSFFATACNECNAGCGVVARVREGRVIKLEGNPVDPIGAGALCARGQAALQGLYNPDRLQRPQWRGPDGRLKPISWEEALSLLTNRLRAAAANPNRVAFVGPPMGPAYEAIIGQWMGALNTQVRMAAAPFDDRQILETTGYCFGQPLTPVYAIDKAQVLVSLGADFLEVWQSPVELARQFAQFHAPRNEPQGPQLGLAYYVGPRMSLTAAKCDHWLPCRPGFEAAVALAMVRVIADRNLVHAAADIDLAALRKFVAAYDPAVVGPKVGVAPAAIEKMALGFAQAEGALALAGTDEDAAHVAACVLNAISGNLGKTVQYLAPAAPPSPAPASHRGVLADMRQGRIEVAVIAAANPQFTLPATAQFGEALGKVPLVVWCGGVPDETAQMAHLLLPIDHWLEDWGDGMPRPGIHTLRQPVMDRVVYSRALGDLLLESAAAVAPSGPNAPKWRDTRQAVQAVWRAQAGKDGAGFEQYFTAAQHEGGVFATPAFAQVKLQPATLQTAIPLPDGTEAAGLTLVAFPHIFLYDGRGADKPWLQEIPEPVTQLVWDSWAEIHPDTAARLNLVEGDLVQLAAAAGSIEVPAHLTPFVHPEVIAVPLGQGHTSYGRYATGRGANPWPLLPADRLTVAVRASRTGARRDLVSPLESLDMLNRPIVETVSLADYSHGRVPISADEEPYPEPWETYPDIVYPKHKWGMTIDLAACTGCSACVAACYAENNLAVVGKEQVARGRIMSWIRLERYVPQTPAAPNLYTMPMLCQHCDHAPCEPVCPVFAAVHNDEGLNLQVYNRCIGTRYCENNCPYKVRRFNFFEPQWPKPLNLQLNPDVTVRGAGVMEKCTFCLQRIEAAEIAATIQDRAVRDGEIVPACAQACPARAITFGDTKDPHSAVMRRRQADPKRAYGALTPLNTRPAITYLRQVFRPRGDV